MDRATLKRMDNGFTVEFYATTDGDEDYKVLKDEHYIADTADKVVDLLKTKWLNG